MNHWKRSFTLTCLCAVLTDEQGHVVYERGRVRPGDKTKNAPEIIPQGQRVSYTYEGLHGIFHPSSERTTTAS